MQADSGLKAVRLDGLGLISVSGADARAFLHAQLTIDVEHLAANRAVHGAWCSAQGRVQANGLVVPLGEGFLLQVSRDLAGPVSQRLGKYVLRSKVKIEEAGTAWAQTGVWSPDPPSAPLEILSGADRVAVRVDAERVLQISTRPEPETADAEAWMLAEIRAGHPLVTRATQDLFVPQMLNLDWIAAVDFDKGCYPGQEVVARAQYRGQVKRRLYRVRCASPLQPGQQIFCDAQPGQPSGTVVNAAAGEALAVLPIASVEQRASFRISPGGEALEILSLPYRS